jgi:membrane protease YdiL (CAAX protease family)
MSAIALDDLPAEAPHPHVNTLPQCVAAVACVAAGCAALAPHWFSNDALKVGSGVALACLYLAFALFARRSASLQGYWQLAFAFFIFAVVQVLNNSVPGFVSTYVLHDVPNAGNPFASTIGGSVVIQLLETLIAVVPILLLTRLAGNSLGSIYIRKGVVGKWLLAAVVFFVLLYVFTATIPLRPGSFAERLLPTNGALTIAQFLALSPALVVMSLTNGLEEELLFRGLFLQKYTWLFGAIVANILQALVFAFAHLGVSYTPSALFFVAVVVFPLGLAAGYLMRATNSILTPLIFHGALDMAIYVTFLTYAS